MSASELLQAAADDLRVAGLEEFSSLIAALDRPQTDDDPAGAQAAVERARALLDPPDADSSFGARYLRALQDDPAVVFAHRDVGAALSALGRQLLCAQLFDMVVLATTAVQLDPVPEETPDEARRHAPHHDDHRRRAQ